MNEKVLANIGLVAAGATAATCVTYFTWKRPQSNEVKKSAEDKLVLRESLLKMYDRINACDEQVRSLSADKERDEKLNFFLEKENASLRRENELLSRGYANLLRASRMGLTLPGFGLPGTVRALGSL